jgi:hypothetical protein
MLLMNMYIDVDVDPMWLSHLIGPAVQKLSLRIIDNIEVVQNFMKSIEDKKHLQYLEFEDVGSLKLYQVIVDGILNLSYVQELKIDCGWSNDWSSSSDDPHSKIMKTELLRSLATNLSITEVDLQLYTLPFDTEDEENSTWTELEYETLQSFKQRNSTCSQIFASPDLIPLCLWPHVFRSVQETNSKKAKALMFQGLVGLAANLPSP